MSDVSKVLEKLATAVKDQPSGVSKDDVLKVIDDKFNDTLQKIDTYRKVEDETKRVNITDISDAAKKKLENIFQNKQAPDNQNLTPDQIKDMIENGSLGSKDAQGLLSKIGGKLIEWSKDIFKQVFKLVGSVVRWTTGTFMNIITGVSSWLLRKIQVAMGIGAARGMAGGLRATGRPSLLKMVAAGGTLAAGAYTGYKVMEGLNDLETYAENQTSQINEIFAEDGSIDAALQTMNNQIDVSSTDSGGLNIKSTSDTSETDESSPPAASAPPTEEADPNPEGASLDGVKISPAAEEQPLPTTTTKQEQDTSATTSSQPESPDYITLPGMTKEQTEKFYLNLATSTTDDLEKTFSKFAKVEGIEHLDSDDPTDLFQKLKQVDDANDPEQATTQFTPPPEPKSSDDTLPANFSFMSDDDAALPDPVETQDQTIQNIQEINFTQSKSEAVQESPEKEIRSTQLKKNPDLESSEQLSIPTSQPDSEHQPISVDVSVGDTNTITPVLVEEQPPLPNMNPPHVEPVTPPVEPQQPESDSIEINADTSALDDLDQAIDKTGEVSDEIKKFQEEVKKLLNESPQPTTSSVDYNLPKSIGGLHNYRDGVRTEYNA